MEKAREGEREAHGESVACGPSALPLLRDQGGGSGAAFAQGRAGAD